MLKKLRIAVNLFAPIADIFLSIPVFIAASIMQSIELNSKRNFLCCKSRLSKLILDHFGS